MNKGFFCVPLIAALLTSGAVCARAEDDKLYNDRLFYRTVINVDPETEAEVKSIVISGCVDGVTDAEIPDTIDNLPVTEIGMSAFLNHTGLGGILIQ